jgi:hypothetical protein
MLYVKFKGILQKGILDFDSEATMSAKFLSLVKDTAFTPETLASLGKAYDLACATSPQLTQHAFYRSMIAKRIIEFASSGERDPGVLSRRSLEALRSPYQGDSSVSALSDSRALVSRRG